MVSGGLTGSSFVLGQRGASGEVVSVEGVGGEPEPDPTPLEKIDVQKNIYIVLPYAHLPLKT